MDRSLLPPIARHRRVRYFEWALAEGRPVDAQAITAVLGAKAEHAEPLDRWTPDAVRYVLWCGVGDWCCDRALDVPPGTAEALWSLLDHLVATAELAPGSGAESDLRAPLIDSGGLDTRGRRRRHPSLRGGRMPRPDDAAGSRVVELHAP